MFQLLKIPVIIMTCFFLWFLAREVVTPWFVDTEEIKTHTTVIKKDPELKNSLLHGGIVGTVWIQNEDGTAEIHNMRNLIQFDKIKVGDTLTMSQTSHYKRNIWSILPTLLFIGLFIFIWYKWLDDWWDNL